MRNKNVLITAKFVHWVKQIIANETPRPMGWFIRVFFLLVSLDQVVIPPVQKTPAL